MCGVSSRSERIRACSGNDVDFWFRYACFVRYVLNHSVEFVVFLCACRLCVIKVEDEFVAPVIAADVHNYGE